MSAPALSHRPAVFSDCERLVALIGEYYTHDHIAFDADAVRPGLKVLLGDPGLGRVFLIEHERGLAGYCILTFGFDLEFGGRLATLTDLYLQPEWRRAGHGNATLHFLAAQCRALGVRAIQLEVERDNLAGQALYKRAGFRSLTRLPMVLQL